MSDFLHNELTNHLNAYKRLREQQPGLSPADPVFRDTLEGESKLVEALDWAVRHYREDLALAAGAEQAVHEDQERQRSFEKRAADFFLRIENALKQVQRETGDTPTFTRPGYSLTLDDLGRMRVSVKKLRPFVSAAGWSPLRLIDRADLRAAAALLLVEQAALRRQLLLAQDELKNRYLGGRGRDASLNKADGALQEILASSGYLSRPAELLDGDGYGLPQTREWTRLERESEQRQLRLNQLTEELDQEVRVLLGDERREELEAIEVNLTQIGERLRGLHKAGGGLELP